MLHILKCKNSLIKLELDLYWLSLPLHDYDIGTENLAYVAHITFNTLLCFFLELQSLEQQLEEAQTENFNIKQMKDLFEQKAAQLATEIAGILNLIFFLANK